MNSSELPTYDEIDGLVDTDTLKLRDVAWELVREVERLRAAADAAVTAAMPAMEAHVRSRVAAVLRDAADGRGDYAGNIPDGRNREILDTEIVTLRSAADVVEGEIGPLYGWLPSWRWTAEMHAALDGPRPAESPQDAAADRAPFPHPSEGPVRAETEQGGPSTDAPGSDPALDPDRIARWLPAVRAFRHADEAEHERLVAAGLADQVDLEVLTTIAGLTAAVPVLPVDCRG